MQHCGAMEVRELRSAYEATAEAYRQKSETMLTLAQQMDQDPEAFHAVSAEVAALWERLCALRGLLSLRLEAPRTSHDRRV